MACIWCSDSSLSVPQEYVELLDDLGIVDGEISSKIISVGGSFNVILLQENGLIKVTSKGNVIRLLGVLKLTQFLL